MMKYLLRLFFWATFKLHLVSIPISTTSSHTPIYLMTIPFSMRAETKKSFFGQAAKVEFFEVLENIYRLVPSSKKMTQVINTFPLARTPKGKGRLWLRIAVKEGKLEEYLRAITSDKALMKYARDRNHWSSNASLEFNLIILIILLF
jgi:hypothetical protein